MGRSKVSHRSRDRKTGTGRGGASHLHAGTGGFPSHHPHGLEQDMGREQEGDRCHGPSLHGRGRGTRTHDGDLSGKRGGNRGTVPHHHLPPQRPRRGKEGGADRHASPSRRRGYRRNHQGREHRADALGRLRSDPDRRGAGSGLRPGRRLQERRKKTHLDRAAPQQHALSGEGVRQSHFQTEFGGGGRFSGFCESGYAGGILSGGG
mmetsp:Transcript_17257/g.38922  ORF Transcript_17257/g.38922 Transcript_17257/m.38922 type:complete len:206 (+) Transcript_17257:1836-2453(+)